MSAPPYDPSEPSPSAPAYSPSYAVDEQSVKNAAPSYPPPPPSSPPPSEFASGNYMDRNNSIPAHYGSESIDVCGVDVSSPNPPLPKNNDRNSDLRFTHLKAGARALENAIPVINARLTEHRELVDKQFKEQMKRRGRSVQISPTEKPLVNFVCQKTCYESEIWTTNKDGIKGWVEQTIILANHTITFRDDSSGGDNDSNNNNNSNSNSSSGTNNRPRRNSNQTTASQSHHHSTTGSNKSSRQYFMNKGGSTKRIPAHEDRNFVLLVTCTNQKKSKFVSFADEETLLDWMQALDLYFSISPAHLATQQMELLMSTPIAHLLSLTNFVHPDNVPDPDFFKLAKTCPHTGAAFSMFKTPSRCDNCGNGFAPDALKPRRLSHLPKTSKPSSSGSPICCPTCDEYLNEREQAANAFELALNSRDLKKVVELLKTNASNRQLAQSTTKISKRVHVSPDYSSQSGLTALLLAVTIDDVEKAKEALDLIMTLDVDVNAKGFVMVENGKPDDSRKSKTSRQRRLSSLTINDRKITGVTPLMAATIMNRGEFVQQLCEKGADPTVQGDADTEHTPLSYAASTNDIATLRVLLKYTKDVNHCSGKSGSTALHRACKSGYNEAVDVLIKHGAEVDCNNHLLQTPLHIASTFGNHGLIQTLIDGGANVNARDNRANTPAFAAVSAFCDSRIDESSLKSVFEALITNGADVFTLNRDKLSSMSLARNANEEEEDVQNTIVEEGEEEGTEDRPPSDRPPSTTKKSKKQFLLEIVDAFGFAASTHRWDDVFKFVTNYNYPVDYLSRTSNCLTALAIACKINDKETVTKLLELGADPLSPCGTDGEQNTVIVAAAFGMIDSLKIVLNHESEDFHIDNSVLTRALLRAVHCCAGFDPNLDVEESYWRNRSQQEKDRALECIELLLEKGANPIEFDLYNLTPFFVATQYGDCSLLQRFVDHHKTHGNTFSLDAPHENGITALMESARLGKTDVCNLLVKGGASLSSIDVNGKNAFAHAVISGHPSTLASLLKNPKCDSNIVRTVDAFGFSLLHQVAVFLKYNEEKIEEACQMIQMLVNAGVDVTLKDYSSDLQAISMIAHLNVDNDNPSENLKKGVKMLLAMDEAIHKKNYSQIETYIERGNWPVDWVAKTQGEGAHMTPLIVAAGDNSDEGLRMTNSLVREHFANVNFMSACKVSVCEGGEPTNVTPLLSAVTAGNVKAAEILLENGADLGAVPVSGAGGSSMLIAGVQASKVELVKMLLDAGSSVSSKVEEMSPFLICAAIDNVEIANELTNRNVDVNTRHTAKGCNNCLSSADKAFHEKMIDRSNNTYTTVRGGSFFGNNTTPLMMAALNDSGGVISNIIGLDNTSIFLRDDRGRNALHFAAIKGSRNTLEQLISAAGARGNQASYVNTPDDELRTPLMDACSAGNIHAVTVLLEHGADPSATAYDDKTTALTESVKVNDAAVISAIDAALMKDDICILNGDIDSFIERVKNGSTPVNFEARCNAISAKKEQRPRSSSSFFGGRRNSSENSHSTSTSTSTPTEISPDEESSITALVKACELENKEWIKILIELGADVNKRCKGSKVPDDSPILATARGGNQEAMRALLFNNQDSVVETNVLGSDKASPLSLAVMHNSESLVGMLLEKRANPLMKCSGMSAVEWSDSIDGDGNETSTPLMLASSTDRSESLLKILDRCSTNSNSIQATSRDAVRNVDEQHGTNKVTALMAASYGGFRKNVDLLCGSEGRAFLEMKDRIGRTAAHFACMKGRFEVVQVLLGKYGASASVTDNNGKSLLDMCREGEEDSEGKRLCASAVKTAISMEQRYAAQVEEAGAHSSRRINEMQVSLDLMQRELATAREHVSRVDGLANNGGTMVERLNSMLAVVAGENSLKEAPIALMIKFRSELKSTIEKLDGEMGRRLTEMEEVRLCLICKRNPRSCILMPCRHMAVCGQCVADERCRTCPICLSSPTNAIPEISLEASIASAVAEPFNSQRAGSFGLFDSDGDGVLDSQRGEGGRESASIPYAPVVVSNMMPGVGIGSSPRPGLGTEIDDGDGDNGRPISFRTDRDVVVDERYEGGGTEGRGGRGDGNSTVATHGSGRGHPPRGPPPPQHQHQNQRRTTMPPIASVTVAQIDE